MGQEDAEKKISKECLRNMVDEAIKTKNICIIERIEKENLRYAQKYAESLISKNEFDIGNMGIGFALLGLGITYIISITTDFTKQMSPIEGTFLIILGFVLIFRIKTPLTKKIEFIHEIILKIEEKL